MKHNDHPEFDFDNGWPKPPTPNGESLRDEGISRVVENTPEDYKARFHDACLTALAEKEWITSEDITAICGMPPNHPHAVGGLMYGLVTRGVLEPMGDAKSQRPASHAARPVAASALMPAFAIETWY
jgi:hypothetical protein